MPKPLALWITGPVGSGKSSIANLLGKRIGAEVLRLDAIRLAITPNPKYTNDERNFVYRALAYMGYLLWKQGKPVILDATDNTGIGRKTAKKLISNLRIIQLECDIEVCMQREKKRKLPKHIKLKDLYARAKQRKIRLPGQGAELIIEKKPWLILDTSKTTTDEAVEVILRKLS